jgi:hypothetical protein
MKSRSGITSRGFATIPGRGVDVVDLGHVRFGSKADIRTAKSHVRFTPESGYRRTQLRSWNNNAQRFHVQNKFKLVCLFDPSHLCHSGL